MDSMHTLSPSSPLEELLSPHPYQSRKQKDVISIDTLLDARLRVLNLDVVVQIVR